MTGETDTTFLETALVLDHASICGFTGPNVFTTPVWVPLPYGHGSESTCHETHKMRVDDALEPMVWWKEGDRWA